jgi:hypothetical protein
MRYSALQLSVRLAALAWSVLVVAIPAQANAQEPPLAPGDEATALIARGIELRKQGRDAEALSVFERNAALHPSTQVAAQIAFAHQALGHWAEAERRLLEVQSHTDEDWVVRHQNYIARGIALAGEHLGWLAVDASPGTEVWMEGEFPSRLPLGRWTRVESGEVVLEARAADHPPTRRIVHLEAKARVWEDFAPTASVPERPPPSGSMPPPRDVSRVAGSERSPAGLGVPTWIAGTATGALLLAGTAGIVVRDGEAQYYNGESCAPVAGLSRYARCGAHRDIGIEFQTVAEVSFAGSAIAAAVLGSLLLFEPRSTTPPHSASFGCGPRGLAFDCRGTF